MADDPHSRLTVSQSTLRTRLDALSTMAPDDPRCAELADAAHVEVIALLRARRDFDAAKFRLPNRVTGAAAMVVALIALIGWFSAWNMVPTLLSLAVGSALVVNPTVRGDWEPRARMVAGIAAVLGALLTPLLHGWSALLVLPGIGWWAWRFLR